MLVNFFERILGRCARFPMFRVRYCVACQSRVGWFLPYKRGQVISPFLRALDMVGSDVGNFSCPRCWSHDRERHLFLYMRETGFLERLNGAKVLHFAPEAWLSRVIANQSPLVYIKADLHPSSADVEKVNMLSIQYPGDEFDVVIANHVLEHVLDDGRALAELYRVLKPGGFAVLQTPYCAKLKNTFCDSGIDDDESRLQAYGQEDHVRLYGSDIFLRFEAAGFVARTRKHEDVLSMFDPIKYGVNGSEPFFLFEK